MAIFGTFATVRAQVATQPALAAVMDYVEAALRPGSPERIRLEQVEVGKTTRVELAGGAFALEQAYHTKARPEGFFETHEQRIDVQVIVSGTELMELAPRERLTVDVPYQPDRDLVKYRDAAGGSVLRLIPGDVAVFFPADAHMPSLQADGASSVVRKTVVKVPVG